MSEQASVIATAVSPHADSGAAAMHHGSGHGVHTFFDTDAYPAAQFEDAGQQKETATLGMWAFLATEVLLFAGLFVVYTVYRNAYHPGFVKGSLQLSVPLGTLNTLVLLTSSFTVVMAVHNAQHNNSRGIVRNLIFTIVLGFVFFIVKGFEYTHDYHIGLIPWMNWNEDWGYQTKLFMWLYFVMTGTHAVHMVVGMTLLAFVAYRAKKGAYNAEYHVPLEMSGLYWHFVDIVWVFLVPTLYLIDRFAGGQAIGH